MVQVRELQVSELLGPKFQETLLKATLKIKRKPYAAYAFAKAAGKNDRV